MAINKFNRAEIVDENFIQFIREEERPGRLRASLDVPVRPPAHLNGHDLLELFESQMMSRHLDLIARVLRQKNASFYTIGSSGHEGNAVLGRLLRPDDPAFLHYRSGAFFMERARHDPDLDPIFHTILAQAASSEDPVAGGRHKVWGSKKLWVLPQTSTISSHLPKAVGTAMALARAKKIGVEPPMSRDAIVVATFGDASTNHASAMTAFNTAAWTAYQNIPVPILFVCEDNGMGISVKSPMGYVEQVFRYHPAIKYFQVDGLDVIHAYDVAQQAIEYCRERRVPVFLHMKVVRLLGHAGSDIELEYRSEREVVATEAKDPVLATARIILESGLMSPEEILESYESIRQRCLEAADRVVGRPRLQSAAEVIEPLAPLHPEQVEAEASRVDDGYRRRRREAFGGDELDLPENTPPKHLAAQINHGLFDIMAKYPEALIFGEDVAKKGGVYHVTTNLEDCFKAGRVFNTLLDETSILGLAEGCGYMGLLPIAEIQYLAYLHNAIDQIRGEACSLQFFSDAQFQNPMIVRIASLAYQKGFGGHFHNDNSITSLRDIPSLIVACPSRGDDAVGMLRTCAALARVDGRVVAFLEPIALYMTKDLYEAKDSGWSFEYPAPDVAVPFGEGRVYDDDASDVAIVTFGNGVYMSLRAARKIEEETGVRCRILDLRWLSPLNTEWICRNVRECQRVLVVDEGRRSGGISEGIFTALLESGLASMPMERVVGDDTYIPLGPAADTVLPSEERISEAIQRLMKKNRTRTAPA